MLVKGIKEEIRDQWRSMREGMIKKVKSQWRSMKEEMMEGNENRKRLG